MCIRDRAERNIETGDMVRVFNDHGEILIEAKVTDRIMPGVGAIPQGMWHDADMAVSYTHLHRNFATTGRRTSGPGGRSRSTR